MALSEKTKLYGVEDAKIALLTQDDNTALTYGSLIDVPGIRDVKTKLQIESKELKGDDTTLEQDSTLTGLEVSFEHAKVGFDVLEVMLGGTTTNSGTGETEVKNYSRSKTDKFNYFKFEAKTPTGGVDAGGDGHIVFHKCKLTDYELGLAGEDYQIFSGTFVVLATENNGKYFNLVQNKAATAIA